MEDIDPADVRAALDRVLASQTFINAGRLSRMLRFVVEQTLAGRGGELKEYLLGVEVFDRPTDYDPRLDSIVRVEARRLRAKLSEYYDAEGAADALRFRLPKGAYAATVERTSTSMPGARASVAVAPDPARRRRRAAMWWGSAAFVVIVAAIAARVWLPPASGVSADPVVTIAVLPFHVFSGREEDRRLADRLTDGVTTELARDRRIGVTAHAIAGQFRDPQRSSRDISQALGVRVLMETTAHVDGDTVRLEARLIDSDLGRKLWVEDFHGRLDQLDALERQLAVSASRFLISRFGAGSATMGQRPD